MQTFKMIKYITVFSILIGLSIGFTSCLKDNTPPPLDSSYGVANLVSFQDNGGSSGGGAGYGTTTTPFPLFNFSFSLVNDTAGFDAIVIYGPSGSAPQDITLNISVNQSALDSFNNANSTSYVAPDNTVYSFPSSVIIPKGKSRAFVHVTITATPSFDFTASYVLPLTITSSSYGAVSANFGTELNSFVVKNQYDGQYSLQIKTIGWAAYGISDNDPGSYPGGMEMVSAGASSVSFYNGTTGLSALEPAFTANNAGATGFGATTPLFTFDPATNNLTSVVNTTPDDGRGRTLYLNPAVTDSRYDPSSKTIYAAYIMTQNGRPNQFIYDTLVYQGPR
jgi:hypothetical protein